ncbi:MAG: sulfotransferase [Nitrospirae bacterium]|nr:sulfotransferase [Nitrospirota bacterium]
MNYCLKMDLNGRENPPSGPALTYWDAIKRKLAPLDANALLAGARRRTRLEDFGDPPCEEALRVLVDACNTEARLSFFGQFAARQHLQHLLDTRLRLESWWRQRPEILERPIDRPLIITGLPRSGTTFLHDLLAQDPAGRVPLTWETMFPLPSPTQKPFARDARIAKAERQLRLFRRIKPDISKAHPVGALLPQECITLMSYVLQSDEFLCTFRIPSYESWLRTRDMTPVYAFHRRFLQHLQHLCPGERWVLKAPDHVHALKALCTVYPDAQLVFLHRDPLKVLGSVANLTKLLWSAFSSGIDPRQVGLDEARVLSEKVRNIMEFQGTASMTDRLINVRYLDLVRDPSATVRSIYERFGLALSFHAEECMRSFLQSGRNKNRMKHVYGIEDFGLDPAREDPHFAAYRERFGVERETA